MASAEAGAFEFVENICRKGNSFVLLGKIFDNDTRLRKPFIGCHSAIFRMTGWFSFFNARCSHSIQSAFCIQYNGRADPAPTEQTKQYFRVFHTVV